MFLSFGVFCSAVITNQNTLSLSMFRKKKGRSEGYMSQEKWKKVNYLELKTLPTELVHKYPACLTNSHWHLYSISAEDPGLGESGHTYRLLDLHIVTYVLPLTSFLMVTNHQFSDLQLSRLWKWNNFILSFINWKELCKCKVLIFVLYAQGSFLFKFLPL